MAQDRFDCVFKLATDKNYVVKQVVDVLNWEFKNAEESRSNISKALRDLKASIDTLLTAPLR